MADVEYAVFETGQANIFQPRGARTSSRSRRVSSASSPMAAIDLGMEAGLEPAAGPEEAKGDQATVLRIVRPEEVEAEREAGHAPMRLPRMPVRLIPQMAVDGNAAAGQPWGIAALGADRSQETGAGVCVAVLDSGIDTGHPAFAGLIKSDNCMDFTDTGMADKIGHGTHCAGIIFGRTVDGRRIGVAPGITNVLIGKIADPGVATTTDHLRRALHWAVEKGADIISLSIGLDFLGHAQSLADQGLPRDAALAAALNDYRDYTRFFDRLMGEIISAGSAGHSALVVAAAGNDSHADLASPYRVAATLPAVADRVLAVGALGREPDGSLTVAPFSNTAANVCAPGVGILSAATGGGYATMSGTSQAAPHVAGVAALLLQKLRRDLGIRDIPPDLLRSRLIGAAMRQGISGSPSFEEIGAGLAVVLA